MTKVRGLARRVSGDHVADLDLTIGDNHPRHQALDQLALLLPRSLIKPVPHTPEELVHPQANTGDLGLAVNLRLQLAHLGLKSLPFLLQSATPAPELVKTHNARQVSLGEPLDLLLKAGLPAPQRLPARLQILRQITLPLAVPGLISAGIFSFTLSWNEFIYALAFIQSSENKTVPVAILTELVTGDVYQWGALMAGSLLGSLPVAIFYSFFVDYYVSSLTGAVKE